MSTSTTAPLPAAEAPAQPAEMGIGRAAALGLIGAAAGVGFSIARSKVTAYKLGPDGFGKAAQILQIVAVANLPATMVTGAALVSSVAEAARRGDHEAITKIVRTAITVVCIVSTVAGILAVVAGFWVLPAPWGRAAWPLTILAAVFTLFSAWAAIPQQVLAAHVKLKELTGLRIAIAAIAVALACGGMYWIGLTGQFIGIAVAALISLPLAAIIARKVVSHPFMPGRDIDRDFVIKAARIGVSALVSGYAAQGAMKAIYWALERHHGAEDVGQFQAAWQIGATNFGLLIEGSIGAYVLPRYAAAQTAAELTREVDNAARFVFKFTPPTLLAAIVMRLVLVRALYSHRFDPAIELLGLQMVADMCKAVSWVLVGPLLYRNKVRAFLVADICGFAMLALGAVILTPRLGLIGVGYAYLAMNVVYLFIAAVLVSRSCGVTINPRHIGLALLYAAIAFAVLHLDRISAITRWAVLAVAIVWWYRAGALSSILRRVLTKLDAVRGRSPPAEKP